MRFCLWISLALGIVAGASPAAASADDCDTASGCPARSAGSFTDSVGVNTHLGYSTTVYWQNWPMIKDRLLELGVSHVRDGTFPAEYPDVIGPTVANRYNELHAAGIRGNLLVGEEQAMEGRTTVQQRLDWIKANVLDFTMSIEGENESTRDAQLIRDQQCAIYSRVKADSALASKLVIGPSSGNFYSDDIWYNAIGDLSKCLDRGNLHPYPGDDPPNLRLGRTLDMAMAWGRKTFGTKAYWATETGYWNNSPDGTQVSEQAAGVYIPRLLMEYFRQGIERTQLYELIDLNTRTRDVIDNYGLLRTDGSKKPAFTAVKNLLAVLRDSASASGSLGFGIACTAGCHSPIRHVVLRMSSGEYVIALWSESRVWNGDSDTPQPSQSVQLTLRNAPGKVEVIAPAQGTRPLSTDTSGSKTVKTVAADDVRLIRISGSSEVPSRAGPCGTPAAVGYLNPAKLRVSRAQVLGKERRLDLMAPITTRARGARVEVTFHADRRKATFNAKVTAGNTALDHIRVKEPITRGQAEVGTGIVNLYYQGDEDTRPEVVRLRAASQRAKLDVEKMSLIGDRLSAQGSVTSRAQGVVRLLFSYVDPDGSPNVHEARAEIQDDGDWALEGDQVPAQLAQCGGYLSIQFTGYFERRIRGEQLAYELNAGQIRRP